MDSFLHLRYRSHRDTPIPSLEWRRVVVQRNDSFSIAPTMDTKMQDIAVEVGEDEVELLDSGGFPYA
jgi:hypothetical protein